MQARAPFYFHIFRNCTAVVTWRRYDTVKARLEAYSEQPPTLLADTGAFGAGYSHSPYCHSFLIPLSLVVFPADKLRVLLASLLSDDDPRSLDQSPIIWFNMYISLGSVTAILACISVCHGLQASQIPLDTPLSSLITSAKTHLANGSPRDALLFYDAAVSRDPSNYLTIFQRGAAFLSIGKNSQALHDFDRVLELKPDFESALLQRSRLRAKSADWTGAIDDLQKAGKKTSPDYEELQGAQKAAGEAQKAEKKGSWDACVSQANVAVLKASTSLNLRRTRAHCHLERGDIEEAISDLIHVLQISPGSLEPHLQISSMLFFALGDHDRGISQIRKCLHSDPESKSCNRLYKIEKKLSKRLEKLQGALKSRKYSNAANQLVGTSGESGLLEDVKEDVKQSREDGYIHPAAPNKLYASLVENTCEAYREVRVSLKVHTKTIYSRLVVKYAQTRFPVLLRSS